MAAGSGEGFTGISGYAFLFPKTVLGKHLFFKLCSESSFRTPDVKAVAWALGFQPPALQSCDTA